MVKQLVFERSYSARSVTTNLVPPKIVRHGCLSNANTKCWGIRFRIGLGFSIDNMDGDNLQQWTIHSIAGLVSIFCGEMQKGGRLTL